MEGQEDAEESRRSYKAPYTNKHPIPTIGKYREEKARRQAEASAESDDDADDGRPSKTQAAVETYRKIRGGAVGSHDTEGQPVYPTTNQNGLASGEPSGRDNKDIKWLEEGWDNPDTSERHDEDHGGENAVEMTGEGEGPPKDTTENVPTQDLKQRRKEMKRGTTKNKRADREVTDPVTHLPVKIHDFTNKDIKRTPENEPAAGSIPHTSTGLSNKSKDDEQLSKEEAETQGVHEGMEKLFPPPDWDNARREIIETYNKSSKTTLFVLSVALLGALPLQEFLDFPNGIKNTTMRYTAKIMYPLVTVGSAWLANYLVRDWTAKKIDDVWDNEMWEAERRQGRRFADSQTPESTQWLNSLFASVWPLINPDLFTSLCDTLEDVMQASLPRMVRMVSVEDLGQGSEALRILGVKWLPTGAAARSVSADGKFKSQQEDQPSDRSVPGQGEIDNSDAKQPGTNGTDKNGDDRPQDEQEDQNVAEGMEAEEGDFVNMEIAFAYRARAGGGHSMRQRSKNAHLYLAFYLPANIKFPVWVELRGLVGVVRLRLQLTPDPPFFSLVTLTFMGQPKVDMSCVPLSQHALNIMDLPLISNFVQSAVDAAMAEYVAPKSLTLDLKDMLMGDDFKKDTAARGVLVVRIIRAFDFKQGDAGIGPIKSGSSDPYVSVGWAKFGKPLWSTRILLADMQPYWDETAFVLVTPQELNVDEKLRLQLWDSDRTSADDDLGRIEIDIKELMRNKESSGKMWNRTDGFRALKAEQDMPGRLEWSVGYYSKTRITDEQMSKQTADPDIKTVDDLKKQVEEESTRKLREAKKDESKEIEQQKAQDLKAREDQMIISAPPMQDYPSGILSIQIHQITGLELEAINKNQASKQEEASDEQEEGGELPSAYCTIILNHQKIYKTRTKPKNSKPFFNAGTEKFIRDWRNTEIHISVRDARVHENDPLLGVIYLPLAKLLEHRSQVNNFFPIVGGIGYGRMRVSIVFRSVQLQAPRNMLGWDFGTLEIMPKIKVNDLPEDLQKLHIKIRTNLGKGKMYPDSEAKGFKTRKDESLKLAVRKRYSSAMILEFCHKTALSDKTPAWCVLWLKDVVDDQKQSITLPVWKGDLGRASTNCIEGPGQKVGTIELSFKFWDGLSGYHTALAQKDSNIADVMQVLDTTYDNEEDFDDVDGSRQRAADSSSDSSDSSDEDDEGRPTSKDSELSEDGKRGTIDQFRDYKSNAKQLHRKNRGVMQWKAPRTLEWMKTKVEHAEQRATGLFSHRARETGIETEV